MRPRPGRRPGPAGWFATRTLRAVARALTARRTSLQVEGFEHLPARGPVVVAARHYHHLLDATALLATIPRDTHVLVALDWVRSRPGRRLMEWACTTARWPFVLRGEAFAGAGPRPGSAYHPAEQFRVLRRAVQEATGLLAEGRVLIVFPEAYPTVDPEPSPRAEPDALLPFRPGFARLARLAEHAGGRPVPIVPAGFEYRPGPCWQVSLRFGPALHLHDEADLGAVVRRAEAAVRVLSGLGTTDAERAPAGVRHTRA